MTPNDEAPKISRHAATRRRVAPAAPAVAMPACPGLTFRPEFSAGRRGLVDLTAFPRPGLAGEAAEMIWRGCHDGTYNSPGTVVSATQALARFGEYLTANDTEGRVRSLMDLREADVDGFDVWVHDVRYEAGSTSPYPKVSVLVAFLRKAVSLGCAHPSLSARCAYASKYHRKIADPPRDAYDEFTMASLRAAARADVEKVLARLRKGQDMARRGGPPEEHGVGTPANVVWSLHERGMVTEEGFRALEKVYRRREITAPKLLDLVYLGIADCVGFFVLLAESTGLSTDSVNEFTADGIVDPDAESGFSPLRYVKRRRNDSDEIFEEVVAVREPFSAGWLFRELLDVTAPARRQLGYGEREGPILLGRVGTTVQAQYVNHTAIAAWLGKNPVATDREGGTLDKLVPSRIRKSYKATTEYVGGGGSLKAVRRDHSTGTFVRYYGNIPFLRPRHDEAIAAGIQEAHDAAMLPHVLVGPEEEALRQRPSAMAAKMRTTEERVREVAEGVQNSWLAGCLDFHDSPFAERGSPCGAPLYGCLDCANAVFTSSKLPGLIRLVRHLVAERQRMDHAAWCSNFGFAYLRTRQIIALYPQAEVEAATAESTDFGRDWMLTQLTHRTRPA